MELLAAGTEETSTSLDPLGGNAERNEHATVEWIRELGRRQWKKQAGYHQQAQSENAFYRYKMIIGGRLRSRNAAAQVTEVRIAVNVLNRILELGAPRSEPIPK